MSNILKQDQLKEVILQAMRDYKNWHHDNFDFETVSEENRYGDTWVETSREVQDEEWERADEDFKDNFDVDDFIHDFLQESTDFRILCEELVKEV